MGRERTRAGKLIYFCVAGLIFFLLAGCTTSQKEFSLSSRQEPSPSKVQKPPEPAKPPCKELLQAKKLFDLGDFAGSLKENQRVLSQTRINSPKDQALFNLGLIYAHVENPQRDSGKALHFFKKIVNDYPQSPLAGEARVFAGVLQENERLKEVIEKSKQVDLDVEIKKREKAR